MLDKIKKTVLTLLAIFTVSLIYETGHVVSLKIEKTEIKSVNIGLPLPFLTTQRYQYKLGETAINLNPLPFLIYVRTKYDYDNDPWPAHAPVNAAGVIANLILAIPFFIPLFSRLKTKRRRITNIVYSFLFFFSLVIIPEFAFPLLSIIILIIFLFLEFRWDITGPVGILKIGYEKSSNFKGFLESISLFSLAFVILNSLPFYPLDGGKAIKSIFIYYGSGIAADFYVFISSIISCLIIILMLGRFFKLKINGQVHFKKL